MDIREGMQVVGDGEQMIGTVESIHGDGFHVNGQHIGKDQVARVAQNRIYLRGNVMRGATRGAADTTEGEIRVPVIEERLAVGKREAEMGEVEIRKTVTQEEQTVGVTLQRDEVTVQERDITDRPLRAGETAFEEGTIRVAVRGEEAVVAKETIVTGEVVIDKERVSEERQVTDTVRKQHVDVEENYRQARTDLQKDFTTRQGSTGRTFEQAEPNYKAGFTAAHDERHVGREFEQVEPEMRREHETRTKTTGTTSGASGMGGDSWEHLREEIRTGWNRARNR